MSNQLKVPSWKEYGVVEFSGDTGKVTSTHHWIVSEVAPGQGLSLTIPNCAFKFQNQTKSMSTDYGSVVVQFPGFKPARFNTMNGVMAIAKPIDWGHFSSVHLPSRSLDFADGTQRRLSRKERGALRTLSKKWNRLTGRGWKARKSVCPFRTLDSRGSW